MRRNIYGIPTEIYKQYKDYINRHIEAVRQAGIKLGVPSEQLLVHDASKWQKEEFAAYAMYFYGGDKEKYAGDFAQAWLHHIHHNPHHWEHWIFPTEFTGSGAFENCLPMPRHYVLEMVADWQGAGFCQTGSWDISEWVHKQWPKLRLHPITKFELRNILESNLGITIREE